jgi:uncharacterized protein YndB with AHSA1/START domain
MATIGTKGSGRIDKTPKEVWDFIVDPALLHHWVKDIEPGGRWLDVEDTANSDVGSRYEVDYSYGRKINKIIFEVTSSDRPERFGVNTVSGPFPITANYRLKPSSDGSSTEVEFEMVARSESLFTGIMFVLTGWFAWRFMKRQLNKELVDLQAVMNSSFESH